jgi:diacylglycerol kinase family enzyme
VSSTPSSAPAADATPRRVTIVVNPERSDAADELLATLGDELGEIDVRRLDDAADLAAEIHAAADDGASVIAAVGGDGTQRTAAAVLRGTGTSLAVVPGGTVNLLGKVLGIESVDDAAAAIRSGLTRSFDVGLVGGDGDGDAGDGGRGGTGEEFVLTATTGYDAAVMHDLDDGAKRFGILGYFATGLRRIRRQRPRPVRVRVDGEEAYRGRAMGVLVANVAQRASPRFTLAPDAEPDDGRLDAVVLRCDTVRGLVRAVGALLRDRRPDEDDVVFAQGRSIEVVWDRPVWSQRDGDEAGEGTRFRYEVAPERVTLCVPPDGPRA